MTTAVATGPTGTAGCIGYVTDALESRLSRAASPKRRPNSLKSCRATTPRR
jgi:hypothetical protein